MSTRLAALALIWVGCNSQPLSSESFALGCSASIRGDFTGEVGGDWTPIGVLHPTQIGVFCRGAGPRDPTAPDFSLFVPRSAGSFTSGQATFVVNRSDDWFRGACSGEILTSPGHFGEQARGRFSCAALTGIVDTPSSRSVTISAGSFDLPAEMPPPE